MKNKISRKRLNFEIRFYKQLIQVAPNFVEALSCLGELYTKKGYFKEGLEVDLRLKELKPYDPVVYYNLACSYSILGEIDKSLTCLKHAVFLGYQDISCINKDKDLANVRKTIDFKEFIKKIKEVKPRI